MRTVLKVLRSKVFLYSLLIIIQLAAIYFVLSYANERFKYFSYFIRIVSFLVAVYIINCPILPEYKIAWIIPVLLFPLFGVPIYLIFGKKRFKRKENRFYYSDKLDYKPYLKQRKEVLDRSRGDDGFVTHLANYVYQTSYGKLNYGDDIKYYQSGETFFDGLLEELKKAEKYVFLEYFIIKPGKMFDPIIDILKDKVSKGVAVYILYDDLACTFTLSHSYIKKLKKAGIHIAGFRPLSPYMNASFNNRNHRKVAVIDGKVGFTGGANLSDEYINAVHPFGTWKDSAIKVIGRTVDDMVLSFIKNWNSSTKKGKDAINDIPTYINDRYVPMVSENYSVFINDTPIDDDSTFENVYIQMIKYASKYVYITTPYLIIDYEMSRALILAAKSGVDVRLIIPGIPDKVITYAFTKAFTSNLINEGVKVYFYKPGFIHAKSFVIDDEYSIVGTANLDYRSLYLHYECGLFVKGKRIAVSVQQDFMDTLKQCKEVTPKMLKTNIFIRFWRAVLRGLAPLF